MAKSAVFFLISKYFHLRKRVPKFFKKILQKTLDKSAFLRYTNEADFDHESKSTNNMAA